MKTMNEAMKDFVDYADHNNVRRLYEVFPGWLKDTYPLIYSRSKGIKEMNKCLHKNDLKYRALPSVRKNEEKVRRLKAYKALFREALVVSCCNCEGPLDNLFNKGTPPNMRLLNKPQLYCGKACAMMSEGRQEKRRATCLEKYGVDSVSKTAGWKKKVKCSFTRRYGPGITNPSHVPAIVGKILRARYGRYEITLEGKTFAYQGYEDTLLKHLVVTLGVPVKNVWSDQKSVGFFAYKHLGKKHNYFPDVKFRHKGKTWYAEVKSVATLACTRAVALRVMAKARAMWKANLNYKVILVGQKSNLVAAAKNVEELTELINAYRRNW